MALERAYYRFQNSANVPASVYWMVNRTKRELYCTLEPGQFVDINTFLGHCWIFEDATTGDCLLANGSCIFTPTKWREHLRELVANRSSRVTRKLLTLKKPLYTLKGLSFMVIRDSGVDPQKVDSLGLPKELKDELIHLIRRQACIINHKNGCSKCPFDLHKVHFQHHCSMGACLKLLKTTDSGLVFRMPHGQITCIPGPLAPSDIAARILSSH